MCSSLQNSVTCPRCKDNVQLSHTGRSYYFACDCGFDPWGFDETVNGAIGKWDQAVLVYQTWMNGECLVNGKTADPCAQLSEISRLLDIAQQDASNRSDEFIDCLAAAKAIVDGLLRVTNDFDKAACMYSLGEMLLEAENESGLSLAVHILGSIGQNFIRTGRKLLFAYARDRD